MSALKQIVQEQQYLMQVIEQAANLDQEFDYEDLVNRIDELKDLEKSKVDGWVYFLRGLEQREAEFKAQIAELQKFQRRLAEIQEEAKKYLLHLHSHGVLPDKLNGETHSLNFQLSPISVKTSDDIDLSSLSPEFVDQEVVYKLNKKAVVQADPEDLPREIWTERNYHVRIRMAS